MEKPDEDEYPQETPQSILDVAENLSDQSDVVLQVMHDDILKDPDRFCEHGGVTEAAVFLSKLILEMNERGMAVSTEFPQPPSALERGKKIPSQMLGAQGVVHTPRLANPGLNRKQRRALQSKARKRS
jgi:hypothetical protein